MPLASTALALELTVRGARHHLVRVPVIFQRLSEASRRRPYA